MYIRVKLERSKIITFVSLLKSIEDNIVFDRIENPKEYIFELFGITEEVILLEKILQLFLKKNIIQHWTYCNISESSIYKHKT